MMKLETKVDPTLRKKSPNTEFFGSVFSCARVSFIIRLQAKPATLLKKRLWHRKIRTRKNSYLDTFHAVLKA